MEMVCKGPCPLTTRLRRYGHMYHEGGEPDGVVKGSQN